ncbi:MAG: GNAT family N-acetyltransferase [bacterium]
MVNNLNSAIQIRALHNSDFAMLHNCWCSAFSDYQVSVESTLQQMDVRLAQDSYEPSLSVGAFNGDEMVGFWLSGERKIGGEKVAYDAGTAIKSKWRRQGISRRLFESLDNELRRNNVSRYIVEVLTDNDDALKMYTKQGFQIMRTMDAYRIERPSYTIVKDSRFKLDVVGLNEVRRRTAHLLDYKPSWQNSWEALSAVERSTMSVIVRNNYEYVAYGIFQPILERYAQIGVLQMKQGDMLEAVKMILAHFMNHIKTNGKYEIINIPQSCSKLPTLLEFHGFHHLVSLYEMERSL